MLLSTFRPENAKNEKSEAQLKKVRAYNKKSVVGLFCIHSQGFFLYIIY